MKFLTHMPEAWAEKIEKLGTAGSTDILHVVSTCGLVFSQYGYLEVIKLITPNKSECSHKQNGSFMDFCHRASEVTQHDCHCTILTEVDSHQSIFKGRRYKTSLLMGRMSRN